MTQQFALPPGFTTEPPQQRQNRPQQAQEQMMPLPPGFSLTPPPGSGKSMTQPVQPTNAQLRASGLTPLGPDNPAYDNLSQDRADEMRRDMDLRPMRPDQTPEQFEAETQQNRAALDEMYPQPQKPEEEESTLAEKTWGIAEAAGTMITGATSGMFGMVKGFGEQLAEEVLAGEFGSNEAAKRIFQESMAQQQKYTYMPKTGDGIKALESVAEYTKYLDALPPVLANQSLVSNAARQASGLKPVASAKMEMAAQALAKNDTVEKVAGAGQIVSNIGKQKLDEFGRVISAKLPGAKKEFGAAGSVGAMEISPEKSLLLAADGLPVKVPMLRGQVTGDELQRKFEIEEAKKLNPALEPIRKTYVAQNKAFVDNFEFLIEEFQSFEGASPIRTGESVVDALKIRQEYHNQRIKEAYEVARSKGALKEPVSVDNLTQFMNENRIDVDFAPVMRSVQKRLETLEVAEGNFENGTLQIKKMNVNQAEEVRKYINKSVDENDDRDILMAVQLKKLLENSMEKVGNEDYQAARQTRIDKSEELENFKSIANLLKVKKGGEERAVAFEHVLEKAVLSKSVSQEGLQRLVDVLEKTGPEGKEALNTLRAATVHYIRDSVFHVAGKDAGKNQRLSYTQLNKVLKTLTDNEKLDTLLPPKTLRNLRLLEQVAEAARDAPPGLVNHSGTASTAAYFMDQMKAQLGGAGAEAMTYSMVGDASVPLLGTAAIFIKGAKLTKDQMALQRKVKKALNLEDLRK